MTAVWHWSRVSRTRTARLEVVSVVCGFRWVVVLLLVLLWVRGTFASLRLMLPTWKSTKHTTQACYGR